VSDKRDLYPELPVGLLATKRDAEAQYRVLEFLTHRPAGQQWADVMEIFEALRETAPKTDFGRVYVNVERLALANYLEVKLGEPERGGRRRKYYRATSDGTRAYNNTETASRSPSAWRHQKPAPALG
jgi:DNA-binding PadR family transcriptional regulator